MSFKSAMIALVAVLGVAGIAAGLYWKFGHGDPTDLAGGRQTSDFPQADVDVFKEMDNGLVLTPDEVKGRNTWILWTAGNEQFWDHMARESYGLVDLIKTLDTTKRGSRFHDSGLINEPGFKQGTVDKFGLRLDEQDGPKQEIDEKVYGRPSGVVGLRIYDNPEFNAAAQKRWDPKRYYSDPDYYLDSTLVRPYRVGMTCGFCHVAPNPLRPPADPENPAWSNLASLIGNQYLREGAALAYGVKKGNFLAEMLAAQPPGTSDTSRIATDHINNPNVINAIFNVAGRLDMAVDETMAGGTLDFTGGGTSGVVRKVPHILKDGADSIGVPGAAIRVFVNIGMFHQYWLTRHNALIGLMPQSPFEVRKAEKNSVYWRATEERLPNLVKFFVHSPPMHLEDADGGAGKKYIDETKLAQGAQVFARNCATCHSSKQPPDGIEPGSQAAKDWFMAEVSKPGFRDGNFFSNDRRIAVTKVRTNSARAMGTNAKEGHVWDNFSSRTYKDQPSPGTIEAYNPLDESTPLKIPVPAGGQGYYRVPSLVSIWSSAPFFHNNALGEFNNDPSIKGRMAAFDDACQKLLRPEKRLGEKSIWRTKERSYLEIERAELPVALRPFCENVTDKVDGKDRTHAVLRIGPIPSGTPINLLANLDPDVGDLVKIAPKLKLTLLRVNIEHMDDDAARSLMRKELLADLLAANKCPDFIEDRGHEYGSDLSDADKQALIEYLKTL